MYSGFLGVSPKALRSLITACVSTSSPTTTPGQTAEQQLFPAHDLSGALGEEHKQVHRLRLQPHRFGATLKRVARGIDAPLPDLELTRGLGWAGVTLC